MGRPLRAGSLGLAGRAFLVVRWIGALLLLISVFGPVPVLSTLFEGPPYGIGILTAGLILAIMVLPFITSISRDVFEAVPPVL